MWVEHRGLCDARAPFDREAQPERAGRVSATDNVPPVIVLRSFVGQTALDGDFLELFPGSFKVGEFASDNVGIG